jgi:hypothetical protein
MSPQKEKSVRKGAPKANIDAPSLRHGRSTSVSPAKPVKSHEKEEPPKKKSRGRHAATEEETKPEEVPAEKVEEVPAKKGRGEI